jgi:hypothetical protein
LSGFVLLWGDPVFGLERPLRIFSQQACAPLSHSLQWVDHWYSGLVTRTLRPFWTNEGRDMPPSFLFVPAEAPFLSGFMILPYRPEAVQEWGRNLLEAVAGLGTTPVVLDSHSLVSSLKPLVQTIAKTLLDRHEIRLHVSDPAGDPATCRCLERAA